MPYDPLPVTVTGYRFRKKPFYTPGMASSDMSRGPLFGNSSYLATSDMSRTPGLLNNIGSGTGRKKFPWQKVFSTAEQGTNAVMPYLSNIVNSFRKPPMPAAPKTVGYVTPRRVNYSDQMAEADRQVRGANLGADQSLDENTAAAVKMGNLTQGIRAKNSISTAEANTNAQLAAQTDQLNAGINLQNTGMQNGYQQELVDRQIAQQREQSQNIANATDKYIASENEKAKADLDLQKLNVYKQLWQNSGVYDRLLGTMKQQGINLPGITDEDKKANGGYVYKKGGYMPVYAGGGEVKTMPVATNVDRFAPWGSLSATVKGEGWRPIRWNNDFTEYQSGYNAAGNNVQLNSGKPTGNVIVRGGNNGMFDVIIRDATGKAPDVYQMKGVDANTAHSYFVNPGSTVDQRVDQIKDQTAKYSTGGSIHIKKSHEGRFTAYKKRTGKTTEEALHSSNPHVRQMANFARNAAKWHHHSSGGYMKVY
jgi:hypothetical protein